MSAIESLPADLARHRVLDTAQAARFCSISVPHWRRLYRESKAPTPLKLGARKLGWRVGDLIDWLETRTSYAS